MFDSVTVNVRYCVNELSRLNLIKVIPVSFILKDSV